MNNDFEKFELRICLIGEEYVGKKSIISRFRTIKSTETLENLVKSNVNYNTEQNKTDNSKEKISRPCQNKEIPKIIPKIREKLENLTNFTKVFRIERNYLELKFFNIPAAEKIAFSDNLGDDDEVEKIHKIRFTNIKTAFSNIIAKKSESDLPIHYLLIFVFDITNAHSLEKIKVYYEEITKHVHFDKSYFRILVGNKIDLKVPYEQIDRDILDSFVASKGLNYYEISSKLYFNFTEFFEKMFFDGLESTFPAFSEEIFKIRLGNCLRTTTTIPKELRNKTFTVNDIPGPQKYNPNVYDMTIQDDFKKAFERSKRHETKIFWDKKGPVFDYKKEFFSNKNNLADDPPKKEAMSLTSYNAMKEEEQRKRKIKEMNSYNKVGYSFGLKEGFTQEFWKKRQEQNNEIKKEMDNVFQFENITTSKEMFSRTKIRESSDDSIREKLKKKKEMIKKIRKKKNEKKFENVKQRIQSLSIERSTKFKGFEDKKNNDSFTSNESNNKYASLERKSLNRTSKVFTSKLSRKEPEILPGPGQYDTRGNMMLKKNFTFGGRHEMKDPKIRFLSGIDSVYLRTDIDELVEKPKFASTRAIRFRKEKLYIPPYPEELYKKLDDMTMKKYEKIKENILIMQQYNSKRVEKDPQETPGPNSYFPSYAFVEGNPISYSIRAKLDKEFLGIQNNQEDPNKLYGLEQSVSYLSKNITKSINPLPDYSIGKPNLPAFSFPKGDRFNPEKNSEIPPPDHYFRESLPSLYNRKKQNLTQGTSARFQDFNHTVVPGPGNYRIPGFTEGVLKKNAKYLNQTNSGGNFQQMDENQNDKRESYDSYNESNGFNKRANRSNNSKDKINEEQYD